MDETESTVSVQCCICAKKLERRELEPHICSEHLDYFPYSCAHCGHYMTTADMVRFHATRKAHLPVKIREIPNIRKEQKLEQALKQSLAGMICPDFDTSADSPSGCTTGSNQSSSLTQKIHSKDAQSAVDTVSSVFQQQHGKSSGMVAESDKSKTEVKDEVIGDPDDGLVGGSRRSSRIASMPPGSSMFDEDLVWKLMGPDSDEDKKQKATAHASPKPALKTDSSAAAIIASPCAVCRMAVPCNLQSAHVKSHMEAESPWTCKRCGFIGKTLHSVKIHIVRKHGDAKSNPQEGEQYSQLTVPVDTMSLMCFGTLELDKGQPVSIPDSTKDVNGSAGQSGIVCNICDTMIEPNQMSGHIEYHLESRPLFGCAYCDFKAKRKGSVQAHITWKHEQGSRNAGILDLSSSVSGYDHMYNLCFQSESRQAAMEVEGCVNGNQPANPPSSGVLQQLTSKAGELRKAHKLVRRNENATKHMTCTLCNRKVRKQMVAAHIYINHIQKSDTLKCDHCGFGVAYNSYRMKVHMKQKHQGLDPTAFTSSCNEMTDVYLRWRKECFPEIGKFHLRDVSKARVGSTPPDAQQDMEMAGGNIMDTGGL